LDLGPEHKYALIAYRSNPFSQIQTQTKKDTEQMKRERGGENIDRRKGENIRETHI